MTAPRDVAFLEWASVHTLAAGCTPTMVLRRSFSPGDKVIFHWGEIAWIISVDGNNAIVDYRDGKTTHETVALNSIRGLAPPPEVLPFKSPRPASPDGCSVHTSAAWPSALAAACGSGGGAAASWICAPQRRPYTSKDCCSRCKRTIGCVAWTHIRPNSTARARCERVHQGGSCCLRSVRWPRTAPIPATGCDSGVIANHPGVCAVLPAGKGPPAELDACERGNEGSFNANEGGARLGRAGATSQGRAAQWHAGVASCIHKCTRCSRCRYLSISRLQSKCAWFAHCNLSDLRAATEAADYLGRFTTLQLRPAADDSNPPPPPPKPSSSPSVRIGIATLYAATPAGTEGVYYRYVGNVSSPRWFGYTNHCFEMGCSLPVWCASARRLRAALPSAWTVELLALVADAETMHGGHHRRSAPAAEASSRWNMAARCPIDKFDMADCPSVRVLKPRARLEAAISKYVARRLADVDAHHNNRKAWHSSMSTKSPQTPEAHHARMLRWQLLKWHFFSLRGYDAILFADLDVDVFPLERSAPHVRSLWLSNLPMALSLAKQGSLNLVCSADHSSPLNAGLVLVMPSAKLFESGLTLLAESGFSVANGWNASGPPAVAAAGQTFIKLDGQPVHKSTVDVMVTPRDTAAFKRNAWSFAGADGDQGFLWFMLFVRTRLGRYAAASSHTAIHWWAGQRKPWQRPPYGALSLNDIGELGCIYEYLGRARGIDAGGVTATMCTDRLRRWRRELEADPRYAAPTAPQSFVHHCPGFVSFPYF